MKIARRLLALAVFAGLFWLAWEFTHRNNDEVTVDLLVWYTPPIPKWAALVAAFGAGALGTGLLLSWSLLRTRLVARRYRKAVGGLESEIHQLRNLPLAGEEGQGGVVAGERPAPGA
jgi:hypothetical protein